MSMQSRLLFVGVWVLIGVGIGWAQEYPPDMPFPLTVGVPVEGNINDGTSGAQFTVQGNAGDVVTLTMEATSGDLDPLLFLFDPNGLPIAQNDDRAEGDRNAQIDLTLPEGGAYIVEATRFDQAVGATGGTYRLLLEIEGVTREVDPLSTAPDFGVDFTQIQYQGFGAGTIDDESQRQYFVVGGEQGDLLRAIATPVTDELVLSVNILNGELAAIGRDLRPREGEILAFAVLPQRDWYLIEVVREEGAGDFSLYVDGISGQRIETNSESVSGQFSANAPTAAYIFDGNYNDQLFISLATRNGNAAPQVRLLDLARREIAVASGERFATVQATLPRSGTYILEVNNTRQSSSGDYSLRLNAVLNSADKLTTTPISYNTTEKGMISDDLPGEVYQFSGKAGELVTAGMVAAGEGLDPLLILMDGDLNELVSNDNTANTRNARITQFALPADGDYYLLATRSGAELGITNGGYDLALTAGAVSLVEGTLSATLHWRGDDDLNLFIREPSGRVLSWSNPGDSDAAELQIDSNTNCTTISTQPVEHIYWSTAEALANGDYEVWVWHQNACSTPDTISFDLVLTHNGTPLLTATQTLDPGQRFDLPVRVNDDAVFIVDDGAIIRPSPQQNASEGGDIPVQIGDVITGNLNDQVYARFYQFNGTEGERVTITAERVTDALDPVLILRDDQERNLAQNDDITRESRTAAITLELPYSGRYVIAVTRFGVREGTTAGDFNLTIQPAPASE